MSIRKRLLAAFDWVTRGDFVMGFIFDWRTWLAGFVGGGGVTFLWAAIDGRSPLDVWLMALVATACAVVVFAGVATLWRKWFSPRPASSPDEASGPSSVMSDWQAGKWEIAYPPIRTPLPDWPIHELFSHIDPDVLERNDGDGPDRWEVVGDHIRDVLSLGRLKIWGRPVQDHASEYLEQRPAQREIGSAYWQSASFSYWFFDETARGKSHTHVPPHSRLPEYTDLQVNRAQALSIWPARKMSRADTVRSLDDLYAEGVNRRNNFETGGTFDLNSETRKLNDWDAKVIAVLDTFSVSDRSRFRTLNRFQWQYTERAKDEPARRWLEAIWNEKLNRLAAIIAESGV